MAQQVEARGRVTADPAARAKVAKLELTVTRKIDGVLLGDHQGLIPGPGSEPGESREYQVGDDVRTMDWSVTARTTVPHVRQTIADRELETWLLVDLSPSIDAGGHTDAYGATGSKRDLAAAATATFAFLSSRSGNRVGLVLVGAGEPVVLPPAGGAEHVRAIVELVVATEADVIKPRRAMGDRTGSDDPRRVRGWLRRRRDQRARASADATPAESALAEGARKLRGLARRRGMIAIVSDFLGPLDWERDLRVLAARQEMVAARLTDPLDVALPVVGAVLLQDTTTGELVEVDVSEQQAADYADAARRQRGEVGAALRHCGAPVLTLRTDRDWVRDVIEFSNLRRRGAFPDGERQLADLGPR